jgi:hypothetical protein
MAEPQFFPLPLIDVLDVLDALDVLDSARTVSQVTALRRSPD